MRAPGSTRARAVTGNHGTHRAIRAQRHAIRASECFLQRLLGGRRIEREVSELETMETLLAERAWMMRIATTLVGHGAADDLVQDTFQAALRSPPSPGREVRPWLASVLRNRARTRWRGDRRRDDRERAANDPLASESPQDQLAQVQIQTRLCEAVRDLDEPFRHTLFAHYFQDKSLAEIARDEGIAEGTVRWRHHEGVARVRKALDRAPGGRAAWLSGLAPLATSAAPRGAALGKVLLVKTLVKLFVVAALVAATLLLVLQRDTPARTPAPSTRTESVHYQRVGLATGSVHERAARDAVGSLRLEGQVVDEDRNPVAGVSVTLDLVPPPSTTTEADGSFHFDRLAPGTYRLSASAGDLVSGSVGTSLSATSDPVLIQMFGGGAIEVTVVDEAGRPIALARTRVDAKSAPVATTDEHGVSVIRPVPRGDAKVSVEADGFGPTSLTTSAGGAHSLAHLTAVLVRGAAQAGRVVDETGAPIAGVTVTAYLANRSAQSWQTDVRSDDHGRFEFPALAPGEYWWAAYDGVHRRTSITTLVTARRSETPVTIVMRTGSELSGRVVDDRGRPVASATVRVYAGPATEPAVRTTSDVDGTFRVGGLAPVPYTVTADTDDAASPRVSVRLNEAIRTTVELALSAHGQIAGVVVDDRGQPAAEVYVLLVPDHLGGASLADSVSLRQTHVMTDTGGAFRFSGLREGAYRLFASRNPTRLVAPDNGTPVVIGEDHARLVLSQAARLKGRLEIDGGGPPRDATVTVNSTTVPTAPDGSFVIEDDVLPGKQPLVATGPEFARHRVEIVLTAGRLTDVGTIHVPRGRQLTGKVVDTDQHPVEGAVVTLRTSTGAELAVGGRRGITDATGRFTLGGVDDRVQIIADHPTKGRSSLIEVTDEAPVLVLRALGTIRGRVTRGGQPVAGVEVYAIGRQDNDAVSTTNEDGGYVLDRVLAGEVTVALRSAADPQFGGVTVRSTVEVGGGATKILDIAMPVEGATVRVSVHARPGAVVDDAFIALRKPGQSPASLPSLLVAKANGMWLPSVPYVSFENVEPGAYELCAAPLTGRVVDPGFSAWLNDQAAAIEVICLPATITNRTTPQQVDVDLPSMRPNRK